MKFIRGGHAIQSYSDSRKIVKEYRDFWGMNDNVTLFVPIDTTNELWEPVVVGVIGHSINRVELMKAIKRKWIPSNLERDPDTNIPVPGQLPDAAEKIARASEVALKFEKAKRLDSVDKDKNLQTEVERDAAKAGIIKEFDGDEGDNKYPKQGVVSKARLRSTCFVVACKLDDRGNAIPSSVEEVLYNPAPAKVSMFNSLAAKARKLWLEDCLKDPNTPKPEFIEVNINYATASGKDKKEKGLHAKMVEVSEKASVLAELKEDPVAREKLKNVTRDFEVVYNRDRNFIPFDEKKLLQGFQAVISIQADDYMLVNIEKDKELVDKNIDLLKDLYPSFKSISVADDKKVAAEDLVQEMGKELSESMSKDNEDGDIPESLLDSLEGEL